MRVLWIRNLAFGVRLEWRGDDKVFVTAGKDGVIDVAQTSGGKKDATSIARLMDKIEEQMHEDATMMEKNE